MMNVKVYNTLLEETGELLLNQSIFGLPSRDDIVYRVVDWQLAKRRAGTHKTKTVSEISGSTKKIYKQKGTGNARHGSKRQIQFRGGAKAFGPVVRSHAYNLPKKVRQLGLKIALSSKALSGDLIIVDSFALSSHKTKELAKFVHAVGASKILLIDDAAVDENVVKASGNLIGFDVLPQIGANVYDIIRKDKLVLTVNALKALEGRLI